jgi:hypothetical protein
MTFLRDYFRILIPLFVVFTAYMALVVPFLEPRKIDRKTGYNPVVPAPRDDWWSGLFQDGDWQRDKSNPPRVVKTDSAILLYKTRVQKSETEWIIKPITILIPQKDTGSKKRAMLIKNHEGAEIQFASAVDWTRELPPVVSGQLLGDISVYSPPDEATKNDGMLINASDLRINKRVIWTNQKIKMQMGNSIVEGSDLRIFLDKDLLTTAQPRSQTTSSFNGLNKLELTYVDRVQIGLEPGGLLPRKDIPDIAQRSAYATLACGGAFEFQFPSSLAILKKGVHMEHIVQGLPIDTFDCHELQITVGGQDKPTFAQGTPATASSNWRVERLEAIGAVGKDNRDHSGWLKLNAPGMEAEAHGQHLVMDLVNGLITLSNRLPGTTSRELTPVYLKRESVQVWSPEVQYLQHQGAEALLNDPNTKSQSPKGNRLGAMLAQGAGRAQMGMKEDLWTLSWGERLIVRPDPKNPDKDLVDIRGSANIKSDTHGRFQAEQLFLWLTPMTPELAVQFAPQYPNGNTPLALPDRMEADGNVKVDSPQLNARVENMQVWFAYQPAPVSLVPLASSAIPQLQTNALPIAVTMGSAPLNADIPAANGLATVPALPPNSSLGQGSAAIGLSLLPPTGIKPAPLRQPGPVPANKSGLVTNNTSPFVVTAKTMRAKVVRTGAESRVEDLLLDGNFALTKNQISDDSPWPLIVTGDRFELKQTQPNFSDITIVGQATQPAKVKVGSGTVVGATLTLKQSENRFSIDHPGEMILPAEVFQKKTPATQSNTSLVSLPSTLNNGLPSNGFIPARPPIKDPGGEIRWHETPKLQWGKRMEFDGRTARFFGGVAITCRMETDPQTLWHVDARASEMAVEMEQPIAMRIDGKQSKDPATQVSVIRLLDSVELRAVQTDMKSRRRSMEQIKIPQLDVMVPTQSWLGYGPGEIWSRRLGNDGPIGGALGSASAKPQVADTGAENNYQCIHLRFEGRMEGNMTQRSATFIDRIAALIGPIASWEDSVNVNTFDRLGRSQSVLFSDQLNIFDASGLSWNQSPNAPKTAAWEIEAVSRVKMQSNTDSGEISVEANSLKYAAASDTVRIEGTQGQPAHINTSQHDLQIINAAYRMKTGEITSMQISKFSGDFPQKMQPGNGPIGQPQIQPAIQPNNQRIPSPRDTQFAPAGGRK